MSSPTANPKAVKRFVWTVSIAIPLVVLALVLIPPAEGLSEETLRRVYWLPRLNAILNASAFTCLLISLMSIRKGLVARHRALRSPSSSTVSGLHRPWSWQSFHERSSAALRLVGWWWHARLLVH